MSRVAGEGRASGPARSPQSLQTTLKQCDDLSNAIVGRLEGFESRMRVLQQQMEYVHTNTQALTTKRENIGKVLGAIDKVMAQLQVASEEEHTITIGIQGAGRAAYVASVQRVCAAATFFGNNPNYKAAPRALKKLDQLKRTASDQLNSEFQRTSSKLMRVVDLSQAHQQAPPSPPEDTLALLCEVGGVLHMLQHRTFLSEWVSTRESLVERSFAALQPSKVVAVDVAKKTAGDLALEQDGQVEKFVHGAEAFLKLMQGERAIAKAITKAMPSVYSMHVFLEAVSPTLAQCIQFLKSLVQARACCDKALAGLAILESKFLHDATFSELFQFKPENGAKLSTRELELQESVTQACRRQLSEMDRLRKFLEDAVATSFADINEVVQTHPVKSVPPNGTVHQLTTNVLQFVKLLVQHSATVAKFEDMAVNDVRKESGKLLRCLVTNIAAKAKSFKTASEGQLFLINNTHHVLNALRSGKASVVDDRFIESLARDMDGQVDDYLGATFSKCLDHLLEVNQERAVDSRNPSKAERARIKDRFSGFNNAFEAVYASQRARCVPDPQLRDHLRDRCKKFLMPIYSTFLSTYSAVPFTKNLNKYLKYPLTTVESLVDSFFDAE